MLTKTARGRIAPRARRPALDRQRVLEAALAIVDAEGLGALSMRRLGAALGVDAMAVYGHVADKDALLDGLVELLWAEAAQPTADATPWTEQLRAFVGAIRALFHRHPHAAPLLLRPNVLPEAALAACDRHLATLRDAGFTEPRAAEILRTLIAYGIGYGVAELACFCQTELQPGEAPPQRERLVRLGQLLPQGLSPRLTRVAVAICVECDPAADFACGLDLLLRGLHDAERGPRGAG